MAENRKEINTNEELDSSVATFMADLEHEKYLHRVATGALTEEEKEDREAILNFIGK